MRYYMVTISRPKVLHGKQRKVSEQYLVDALSFTEAEARVTAEVSEEGTAMSMTSIVRPKIAEVFEHEDRTFWYKVGINFISIDEKTGDTKRTKTYFLEQAETFEEAVSMFKADMAGTMCDYEIVSVQETAILDYFKYEVKQ